MLEINREICFFASCLEELDVALVKIPGALPRGLVNVDGDNAPAATREWLVECFQHMKKNLSTAV
jgi:hypothetical protein